jgi:thymidylate synthase (FAD)
MQIVNPSHEILTEVDTSKVMKLLELCGRTAYKSEDKITEDSASKFIRAIIDRGHESVIEHFNITVRLITDRGVTHELVRHRLVSFTQESTRYCNYSKAGVVFIKTPWPLDDFDMEFLALSEKQYNRKIRLGWTPEQARYFLPNGLKTEIIVTANLREWRHILKLRTSKRAHPQMRQLMIPLLNELKKLLPVIFGDITAE